MTVERKQHNLILFIAGFILKLAVAVFILTILISQGIVTPIRASQSAAGIGDNYEKEDAYVQGEVIVLLTADVDRNCIMEVGEDYVGVEASLGGKIERRFSLSREKQVLRVKLPAGKSVEAAIAENWAARDRRILAVEPNYRVRIARTPNDPNFAQLWGMHNIGQTGGKNDADIDAPQAWEIATGVPETSDVIVAVIDTGIDYLHPDLAENMWVNSLEIPGNNIDDDGNGYIDDIYGYDFYQNDGDPSDASGHGTHCAGTIAGVGNNGLGVAGINWKCKLMAVRFLSAGGGGNMYDGIEAINYAVVNGARILSNSWGGGAYLESMEAAIINARDNGVLFVAAAGNSSLCNDIFGFYPSNYKVSNVISVAATDHNDSLAAFSNYGVVSVHLGAPGVYTLSSVPKYKNIFFEDFQGANIPGFEGTQMIIDGTVNRWGTLMPEEPPLPPVPGSIPEPTSSVSATALDPNNIAARGDWANSWPYLENSNGSIVTPPIDTRGLRGLALGFQYRYQIGKDDELTADVWDGTRWNTIFSINNDCCYHDTFYYMTRVDIPELYRNEEMRVRFRWMTNFEDNDYFGAEVDNILIQCIEDHNENYAFYQGTSMATPHVAGVAALLMANLSSQGGPEDAVKNTVDNNEISLDELKARIVQAGDLIPSLENLTISGRRLNAYNALTVPPGITVSVPNGGENWGLATTRTIKWISIGGGEVLDIYLHKGGNVYVQVAENIPNNGKFTWTIPATFELDSDYRIEITDGRYSDISDEDFDIICPTIKPDFPIPYDGAKNVPSDTRLVWDFEGLEPVTITFDEVAEETIVNGMSIANVQFGFYADDMTDATVTTKKEPYYTKYIEKPYIEGDANGVLTLFFTAPVYGISYGFALNSSTPQTNASIMVLLDSLLRPIGSFSADAMLEGYINIEGLNRATSTKPISYAIINFSHPDTNITESKDIRFALDNLTYSPAAGIFPEPAAQNESCNTNEPEIGEDQEAKYTDTPIQFWSKPENANSEKPNDFLPDLRISNESGVKVPQTAALETISTNGSISVMHSGGPDAGGYIFIDSSEPNGPSFDWIEIAQPNISPILTLPDRSESVQPETAETINGIHLELSNDSFYFPVELPFGFTFYGKQYKRVAINSNGTIYFRDVKMDENNDENHCIPCRPDYVERFIAVYWDDLNPYPNEDENVYYAIVGEAPNRILVVQWENVRYYNYFGAEDRVTCQAQLFEGSDDILLLYADPGEEFGSGATVGIQRDPYCGLNYSCNLPALYPELAILFKHLPPCPKTWDIYFGTDPNELELVASDLTKPIYDPTPEPNETLRQGIRYYWQVVAKNCCGEIDGNDWSFATENTLPIADAGENQVVECACNTEQRTKATLDGTGSFDPEGNKLTYTWTGPFIESPTYGPSPTVTLDSGCPGEFEITLVVNDGIDDSKKDKVIITVVDTMPPEFELSVTPSILWPPNHKMVLITPSWMVSDKCDTSPEVSLIGISINEDDNTKGDGQTDNDIQIGNDGSIYVRSERSGNNGRIYTITYQAVDDCGNVTIRSATVSILHDFKFMAAFAYHWLWIDRTGAIPADRNNDIAVNIADFKKFAEKRKN